MFEMKDEGVWDTLRYYEWRKDTVTGYISCDVGDEQYGRRKRFDLKLVSTTVRGILDALVAADTSYYWLSDGPTINIIQRCPKPKSDLMAKLEQKLRNFEVSEKYSDAALAELITQAEAAGIRGLYGPKKPTGSMRHELEGWVPVHKEEVRLSLKNKSVRECINAIMASVGRPGQWDATPLRDGILLKQWIWGSSWNKVGLSPTEKVFEAEKLRLREEMKPLQEKFKQGTLSEEERRGLYRLEDEYTELFRKQRTRGKPQE